MGTAAVRGVTVLRFPKLNLDDREALAGDEVVDEAGDVLGRGVDVEDVHRLAPDVLRVTAELSRRLGAPSATPVSDDLTAAQEGTAR